MCMNCYGVKFVQYKEYTSDFMSRIIFEMLIVAGVIEKFLTLCKTRRFVTVRTRSRPWIEEGEFRAFDVCNVVRAVFCPSGPPVNPIFGVKNINCNAPYCVLFSMVMLTSVCLFLQNSFTNISTAKLVKEMDIVCGTPAMSPKECLLSHRRFYKHPNAVLIAVWSTYCWRVGKRKLSPARVLQTWRWMCVALFIINLGTRGSCGQLHAPAV